MAQSSDSMYQPLIDANANVSSPEFSEQSEANHAPAEASEAKATPLLAPQLVAQAEPSQPPRVLQPEQKQAVVSHPQAQAFAGGMFPYQFGYPPMAMPMVGGGVNMQGYPPGAVFYAIPPHHPPQQQQQQQQVQQGQASNANVLSGATPMPMPMPMMAQWPQFAQMQPSQPQLQGTPQSQQQQQQHIQQALSVQSQQPGVPTSASQPQINPNVSANAQSLPGTFVAPQSVAAPQFMATMPPPISAVPIGADGRPLLMYAPAPYGSPAVVNTGAFSSVLTYSDEKKKHIWMALFIVACVNALITLCSMISPGVLICGSGSYLGYFYACVNNYYIHSCGSSSSALLATPRAFISLAFISVIPLVVFLFLLRQRKHARQSPNMMWVCFALCAWNWLCNMVALPSLATGSQCFAPHALGVMQILVILADAVMAFGLFVFAWKRVSFTGPS